MSHDQFLAVSHGSNRCPNAMMAVVVLLLWGSVALLAGLTFREAIYQLHDLPKFVRRSRARAPECDDVSVTETIPIDRGQFAAKVDKHIVLIVSILGMVTSATFVGFSIIVSQVGPNWFHLPNEVRIQAFFEPSAVIVTFLYLGVAGLLYGLLFILLPSSWTPIRDALAATIILLVVFLVISLVLLPDPILKSLDLAIRQSSP